WSDREWILDGAAVHVSMVGFDRGDETARWLDGNEIAEIHADLSSGVATVQAHALATNRGVSFMGDTKGGAFELPLAQAFPMLLDPNPSGRPNSDVLVPWCNGLDLARRNRDMFIVDFGTDTPMEVAASYAAPWARLEQDVKPQRAKTRREAYRERWWLHVEARQGMRRALVPLGRFLATLTVSKHRLFDWFEAPTLPDHQLIVFALDGSGY